MKRSNLINILVPLSLLISTFSYSNEVQCFLMAKNAANTMNELLEKENPIGREFSYSEEVYNLDTELKIDFIYDTAEGGDSILYTVTLLKKTEDGESECIRVKKLEVNGEE